MGNFDYSTGIGVALGATYSVPLKYNLFVKPGAMLYYDTFRMEELTVSDDAANSTTFRPLVKKTGLRIPLLAGWSFINTTKGALSIFTGPEFNMGFTVRASSSVLKDAGINQNLYSDKGIMGGITWRRFNVGWQVGLSATVHPITISLSGTFGLTNQLSAPNCSFREKSLRLSGAYAF